MNHQDAQFLTFFLDGQMFGVPVLEVNDVLAPQRITPAPLAPESIAGVMNLRGRIVTAIDVGNCLGQPPRADDKQGMSVVIDRHNELFSLIIDSVGDVLSIAEDALEDVPPTLDQCWRSVAAHIHRLEEQLLVILDTNRLLESVK